MSKAARKRQHRRLPGAHPSSTTVDLEVNPAVLEVSRVILCKACYIRPAVEFVAITLEHVTAERITYQLFQLDLCEQCAQSVAGSTASPERMAQVLAGGAQ